MRKLFSLALGLVYTAGLSTSLLASDQLKVRSRYTLRPGDSIETQYRLTPDLDQTVTVEPDGYINLRIAGDLKVDGLTIEQARALILSKDAVRLNNPELNLVLKEFTRPMITVAGEVRGQGRIEYKESTSALAAVMQVGGFTNAAKSGQVIVFRKINNSIAEVREINLSKIKKTSDLERDVELEPGDIVYVPRDRITAVQHYMSLVNVGTYFNPTQF